ncbi:ubiE [Gossypium arboreum]|uniref:UbiE n=1 Tax=Gossypium arboreum TaxID=29729 RepID=A0A0B0PH90_GOSAR|nr:ubiE [Gossypium arboreum]
MAILGLQLQQRFPVLTGVCYSRLISATIHVPAVASVSSLSCKLKKWNNGGRLPRRLVVGLGASFWAQYMNMASNSKSFIASARLKGAVEQAIYKLLKMASSVSCFPVHALQNVEWPEQFPFKDEDFQRFDETPDSLFYEAPRFVTHIDDAAIAALTKYYSEVFPPSNTPGVSILDMCSSWVSHFPKGYKQERVVGMGMNEEELKRNPVSTIFLLTFLLVLTEYVVQDLNLKPKLPFEDNSFDVITNVVSVDYLTKPLDVFKEMCRILKPGGLAIMSFSNRCFWTKAISIWTSTGDTDHALIVGSYFHYAGGFEPPQAVDISPNPGRSDPMYIVFSRKLSTA